MAVGESTGYGRHARSKRELIPGRQNTYSPALCYVQALGGDWTKWFQGWIQQSGVLPRGESVAANDLAMRAAVGRTLNREVAGIAIDQSTGCPCDCSIV